MQDIFTQTYLNIITLGRREWTELLRRAGKENIEFIINDLQSLHNSKKARLACRLICNNLIKKVYDKRMKWVYDMIDRHSNFDVDKIHLLDDIYKKFTREKQKSDFDADFDLDPKFFKLVQTIPQYKVEIFEVEDSYEGMMACREVIDLLRDDKTNCWCLTARHKKDGREAQYDRAWNNWIKYNAYPKLIAFQDNELLAFCANSVPIKLWWDLKDIQYNELLVNGHEVKTVNINPYSELYRTSLTISQLKNMRKNEFGHYLTMGLINITDDIIVNGRIPIDLDLCGKFICEDCLMLTSMEGFPNIVHLKFSIKGSINISLLSFKKYYPEVVDTMDINTAGYFNYIDPFLLKQIGHPRPELWLQL